ncbi:MAG: sulfatase [Catalinimonas sp.]
MLLVFAAAPACGPAEEGTTAEIAEAPPKRPNILWLVAEDLSPYLPAFGDSTVATPNLSRLAAEGVRYTNMYSPSGVCAPSRAAIATGLYPSSFGANHMRTGSYTEVTGLPKYQAVPPPEARMVSEWMRLAGYYCTNNVKGDYQFDAPATAWDAWSNYAHWRNRATKGRPGPETPFYAVFNFGVTHESGLFEPYGPRYNEQRHYQAGDTSFHTLPWGERSPDTTVVEHLPQDADFSVPPYLPDNEVTRRDLWKMYNNIAEMDRQLGAVLDQLEADGLLEETIIFFYGDHGGPLPRQKRLIYDSGLRVPLIVRFPNGARAGEIDDQLCSFVDFAPTLLHIAGQEVPDYMHGRSFVGDETPARDYIHAAADRFDGFTDAIRAVRDARYKYIRNYRPEQGYYLPVTYREKIPTMRELLRLRDAGELNEAQAQWFRETKPREELYDCQNDPHELRNLADDPAHAEKLAELSAEMDRWLADIGDRPNLPERELIADLWDGADAMPTTANPRVETGEQLRITCDTEGASIGYRVVPDDGPAPDAWQIYQKPVEVPAGTNLEVVAHRIGYQHSDTVRVGL